MTDINRLITLNVELEGALRVLLDRDNDLARSVLSAKYEEYSQLITEFLGNNAVQTEEAFPEPIEELEFIEGPRFVEDSKSVEGSEFVEKNVVEEPVVETRPNMLLKSFTLNDKFRFIRDVFGGNEADFNDTINLIAAMDSYDEAADYLYNDMMLDANNQSVADFMDLIGENLRR